MKCKTVQLHSQHCAEHLQALHVLIREILNFFAQPYVAFAKFYLFLTKKNIFLKLFYLFLIKDYLCIFSDFNYNKNYLITLNYIKTQFSEQCRWSVEAILAESRFL